MQIRPVPPAMRLPHSPENTPPRGVSHMSHCDTSWIASTNVTLWRNRDNPQIQNPCHTVTLSGQLAQCHKRHTFQLQKHVFSYDRCDIVTSVEPPYPDAGMGLWEPGLSQHRQQSKAPACSYRQLPNTIGRLLYCWTHRPANPRHGPRDLPA